MIYGLAIPLPGIHRRKLKSFWKHSVFLLLFPLHRTLPFWHFWSVNVTTPHNSPHHQLVVLQFNSILTLFTWSWHRILQIKGSVPQDFSHLLVLQMFDANSRSLGYPELLFNLDTNLRFPWSSLSLGSISLLEWFTELRENTFTKGYGKGYRWRARGWEVRSGRDQSAGTSVPVELVYASLSVLGLQTYLEAHQSLYYW